MYRICVCVCVWARAWNTPAQACWSLYQFSAPAGEWSYHNIDTHEQHPPIWARAVRFWGALFTRRCCWQPEGLHWQESLVLSQHCNPQARHLVVSWSTFPKWVSITSHHRPAWHLQGCHRCCHPQFKSAGSSMPNGMNSSTAKKHCSISVAKARPPSCHHAISNLLPKAPQWSSSAAYLDRCTAQCLHCLAYNTWGRFEASAGFMLFAGYSKLPMRNPKKKTWEYHPLGEESQWYINWSRKHQICDVWSNMRLWGIVHIGKYIPQTMFVVFSSYESLFFSTMFLNVAMENHTFK